ncbi:hypothetical protein SAMD00019534_080420 [Acytostelium subglobosum LB1]|uniref:hypothetical protein n=1 Tax=Acytostelium subglobosum LB1 TaxID=1410327 RepID=UPI0006451409|nr:hypothetical protein SAMD00019534_080420 [Acytostelium subglobosum LB1]GAM24867.1 hypothetical protein SAMD00019534_080420 [Acytostelium subglobosum LB1]|eukprot:XP_012751956.1 hypothetical protein SAMD00019534_080420 [Acytostelium subglobosum LB1]
MIVSDVRLLGRSSRGWSKSPVIARLVSVLGRKLTLVVDSTRMLVNVSDSFPV